MRSLRGSWWGVPHWPRRGTPVCSREWLSSLGPGLEEPHSGFRLRKAEAQLFGAACEGASGDGDGGRAGSPPGLGQGLPGPGEVLALSDATAVRGGTTLPH